MNLAGGRGMGITMRTALLCWLVSITTLLIFVAVVIPQQKQALRSNLESKAHGIAVSLRDLTVGAVVNEDFGSVVDHCVEVLAGDGAIDHLVVLRDDGFALIHERTGWRMITNAPPNWISAHRRTTFELRDSAFFGRRTGEYAHPFDYSGIQWGWIRVGLSLDSYDASVRNLYVRTLMLAVVCLGLSLVASVVYARRMVRPILGLKGVVERVAGGDLSARAVIAQADEIGILAGSVNAMTEALLRRDRILQAVHYAAQQFLTREDWRDVIGTVLEEVGGAGRLGRIQIYQNETDESGVLQAVRLLEWYPSDRPAPRDLSQAQRFPWQGIGYDDLSKRLADRQTIVVRISEVPPEIGRALQAMDIRSASSIPVFVRGLWWGVLSLQDCMVDRDWPPAEIASFRAVADMLGAAIERRMAEDELLEAKQHLEERVLERTRQLEEKVEAEKRARAELAEAQQRLIEASRRSGMAEVATGILHNVGNVLNSVNVSASLAAERLRTSRVESLGQAAAALRTGDPARAGMVAGYLDALARVAEEDRAFLRGEIEAIQERLGHIKGVVAMQQSHAKVAGVPELNTVETLVEEALKLNLGGRELRGFELRRNYRPVPPIVAEKHRVLQILVNLIRNAEESVLSCGRADVWIELGIAPAGPDRVRIQVRDNGRGIAAENLTRIFSHGFTTKPDGHGFGLHAGALAARELGGSIEAASEGRGLGATFTFELPLHPPRGAT